MVTEAEHAESALIDSVCERVRERMAAADAAKAEEFVRQYYWRAPAEDLLERDTLDLYGAALAHWNFARRRVPGTPSVRVYNPSFEQNGWQSPHTAIEIVTDDMPFLVDSVSLELSRLESGIHVNIHPVVRVRRGPDGELEELDSLRRAAAGGRGARVAHARRGGSPERGGRARGARPGAAARARPGARDGRGLAGDARASRRADRRARGAAARARRRRRRGGERAARLDRGPPLHLPRLSRVQAGREGRRGPAAPRRRLRARHPARRPAQAARFRQAAAARARAGARAASARPHEGERALPDPPRVVPRLRRRQALRAGRRGRRRAALRRPLHDRGLSRRAARHPGRAPQGRGGPGARRLPAREPRREGR